MARAVSRMWTPQYCLATMNAYASQVSAATRVRMISTNVYPVHAYMVARALTRIAVCRLLPSTHLSAPVLLGGSTLIVLPPCAVTPVLTAATAPRPIRARVLPSGQALIAVFQYAPKHA